MASFYKKYPIPPKPTPFPADLTEFFPPLLPSETEDCLFLDVHVPKEILDNKGKRGGAAVFVWVHGGGLVLGSKDSDSNFKGLLARSRKQSKEPIIAVSINYRVSKENCTPLHPHFFDRIAWCIWLAGRAYFEKEWRCVKCRSLGSTTRI